MRSTPHAPSLPLLCLAALGAAGAASSCAATPQPVGRPDDVAARIVTELEAGRPERADQIFRSAPDDPAYRERIYPILYAAADERYQSGEAGAAADLLRFTARHYPEADAVREALVYSLFLERAASAEPDEVLVAELDRTLLEARARSPRLPPWVDLVEAQVAIDRGDLPEAREAFSRFHESWDGEPASLALYVEDVGRYLASH